MRLSLKPHPDSRSAAVTAIAVEVTRPRADELALRYMVSGDIARLRLPALATPARADELWKHTCFEVFLRPMADAAYVEFNFAPSTQWAAYAFDGYRTRTAHEYEVAAPRIEVRPGATQFELRSTITLPNLSALSRLGLSAVIEETNGHTSYWALAHPPGRADFHHADCFATDLPAAETS